MKANELRIGNYVNILHPGTKEWGITAIKAFSICNMDKYPEHDLIKNNFKPIELSPEILEKCGFKKEERGKEGDFDGIETVYHQNGVDIFELPTGFAYATYTRYTGRGFKGGTPISYLHQLQNLFWCLCEKELDVKLQ